VVIASNVQNLSSGGDHLEFPIHKKHTFFIEDM